jgi:16S rRNA (guanine966-N2)-methyltransferase
MLVNLCDLRGAVVTDLFAGSGILGVEALSRGADRVTFVERNRKVAEHLRRSLADLGQVDRATVVQQDVARYLSSCENDHVCDIVFADPPYRQPMPDDALREIRRLLRTDGLLVLERSAATAGHTVDPASLGDGFHVVKERVFGDTAITIAVSGDEAAEQSTTEME